MGERERALFGKRSKEMGEIMDWTRPLTSEEQQQLLAEAREKYRRDRLARDENMFEQGMEKGKVASIAEGMEKGKVAGIAEGMEKGMQAVALSMLKAQADIAFISKITGLSTDEIDKLKKKDFN